MKEKDRDVRAADEVEIVDILQACTNIRDQLLLLLIAETGFRIGEILGLDYTKDIDYKQHNLKVYFRDDNDNDARAKNAEYRSAKISNDTFKFLMHYLSEYRSLLQHQNLLFINIKGKTAGRPMRVESVYDMLELYDFCADEKIDDIEQMELAQEQQFKGLDSERLKPYNRVGIISFCRKALFMQTEKINWNAHVWYMERFQIQPERLDAASPVSSISFTEVTHKKNRELLKKYIRYGLGITNLSVSVIRGEHSAIRNFLNDICQDENEDVCSVTPAQMDDYFKKQRQRSVQAETYNKNVMCIQHFFNFLKVRQYIERIPFDAECCLKKIIPRHLDRSVAQEAADEILEKLCCFPETIRIMYLHLWGVGLRISEVCTLKGNAYYIQGKDAWIQVYQIKMRTYKRIPIPDALYKLTKVYLKKHGIKADDYVFQNAKGGAYCKSTFRYNMLKYCELNNIQNGGYVFKSHDYRHTIATYFYDMGVSLQSIRDYLGHDYEEMTEQYIDYMPKKIEKASEEYFSRHSLAACMKRGEKTDG